jgi:hypothetical protein
MTNEVLVPCRTPRHEEKVKKSSFALLGKEVADLPRRSRGGRKACRSLGDG